MTFTTSSQHYNTPALSLTGPGDSTWQPFPNYAGLHLDTQFPAYPISYPASDQSHSPLSSHVENDSHSSENNTNDLSPQSVELRNRRSFSQDSRDSHQSYENISPSTLSMHSGYVHIGPSEGYASSSDRDYVLVHTDPSRAESPKMEICPKLEVPSSPDSDSSFQSSTKGKQKRNGRKGRPSVTGGVLIEFPVNSHARQVQASRVGKKPVGGRTKGQKLPEDIAAKARHMRRVGSCWSCLLMRETVSLTH
jgi:hypothetical protein